MKSNKSPFIIRLIGTGFTLVLMTVLTFGRPAESEVRIARLSGPVTLDGRIDEPAWREVWVARLSWLFENDDPPTMALTWPVRTSRAINAACAFGSCSRVAVTSFFSSSFAFTRTWMTSPGAIKASRVDRPVQAMPSAVSFPP